MADLDLRNLDGRRTEIIGKSAREKIALIVVSQLFEQGRAQTVGKSAVHLAFYDFRIKLRADVVNRSVFVDADRARVAIDLDCRQINHKTEGDRRCNPIFIIRRVQDRRRDDGAFMKSRTNSIGQTSRIPMRARRRLAKRQSPVGLTAYPRITFMQLDLIGSRIQGSSGK